MLTIFCLKVVLVEDHAVVREQLTCLLADAGIDVVATAATVKAG